MDIIYWKMSYTGGGTYGEMLNGAFPVVHDKG